MAGRRGRGGCVELSVESGVDGGEWVCGGDGESARVDGVWAGIYRWGEWGLGWEGLCRFDEGPGLRRDEVSLYRQDAGVCAGGELRRVYGGLDSDAYGSVRVHCDA